jgi:hypothetical protein
VLIILAIVGLVALLVVAYKKFDWFRKFVDGAWQGIQKVIRAVVDWFMTNAWPIIKRIIGFMVAYYKLLWKVISAVFSWIWKVVSAYITFFRERVWPIIRWVIDKVAAYYRWLWGTVSVVFRLIWVVIQGFVAFFRDKVWPVIRWVIDKVKLGFQVMWSTVAGVWNAVWAKVAWVRDKLYTAAMAIKGFFTGIWDGIKDAAQAAFDWVRDIWNRTLGGKGFHIPGTSVDFKIPMLAAGGIVTRPTLALVGEAGPEAVIPLRRNCAALSAGTARMTSPAPSTSAPASSGPCTSTSNGAAIQYSTPPTSSAAPSPATPAWAICAPTVLSVTGCGRVVSRCCSCSKELSSSGE